MVLATAPGRDTGGRGYQAVMAGGIAWALCHLCDSRQNNPQPSPPRGMNWRGFLAWPPQWRNRHANARVRPSEACLGGATVVGPGSAELDALPVADYTSSQAVGTPSSALFRNGALAAQTPESEGGINQRKAPAKKVPPRSALRSAKWPCGSWRGTNEKRRPGSAPDLDPRAAWPPRPFQAVWQLPPFLRHRPALSARASLCFCWPLRRRLTNDGRAFGPTMHT